MAIASKPTPGLNVFAFQYVNSQCQHDSLSLKLAAKLHLFTETAKFLTDYFISSSTYILRIYFFSDWQSCNHLLRRKGKAIDCSLFAFIIKITQFSVKNCFFSNSPPTKTREAKSKTIQGEIASRHFPRYQREKPRNACPRP